MRVSRQWSFSMSRPGRGPGDPTRPGRPRPPQMVRKRLRPPAGAATGLALILACSSPSPGPNPTPVEPGRVTGRILEIDRENNLIVLSDAGRRSRVTFDEETLIKSRMIEIQPGDLREGDRLIVSLDRSPAGRARIISLAGPQRTPRKPVPAPEEEDRP